MGLSKSTLVLIATVAGVVITGSTLYFTFMQGHQADFSMSENSLQGATQPGGTVTDMVQVDSNNGYAKAVALDTNQLPSGIGVSFSPQLEVPNPGYTSIATITVSQNVSPGSYLLSIQGAGTDGKEHTLSYTVNVEIASTSTPTPTQTPTSTPSPSNGPPETTVTTPQNGAQVGASVGVSGTAKNIGSGQYLWMAVYDYSAQRYYPHQGPIAVSPSGQWQMTAFFGSNGKYDIVLFVVNENGNSQLLQYQQSGTNAGTTSLPAGYSQLSVITVTKTS